MKIVIFSCTLELSTHSRFLIVIRLWAIVSCEIEEAGYDIQSIPSFRVGKDNVMTEIDRAALKETLEDLKSDRIRIPVQFKANRKMVDIIDSYADKHNLSRARAAQELILIGHRALELIEDDVDDVDIDGSVKERRTGSLSSMAI